MKQPRHILFRIPGNPCLWFLLPGVPSPSPRSYSSEREPVISCHRNSYVFPGSVLSFSPAESGTYAGSGRTVLRKETEAHRIGTSALTPNNKHPAWHGMRKEGTELRSVSFVKTRGRRFPPGYETMGSREFPSFSQEGISVSILNESRSGTCPQQACGQVPGYGYLIQVSSL